MTSPNPIELSYQPGYRLQGSGGLEGEQLGNSSEPVTMGLPLPKGACTDVSGFRLQDSGGQNVEVQVTIQERWPSGSLRFVILDWAARQDAQPYQLHLQSLPGSSPPETETETEKRQQPHLVLTEEPNRARVATPYALVDFPARGPLLETAAGVQCQILCRATAEGDAGVVQPFDAVFEHTSFEERGPLRCCVVRRGRLLSAAQERLADLTIRIELFASSPCLRIAMAVTNPRAATHPRGFWQLGDDSSIYFESLDVELKQVSPAAASSQTSISLTGDDPWQTLEDPEPEVRLLQLSSGGAMWDSPVHRNRKGEIPLLARGFTCSGWPGGDGRGPSADQRLTPAARVSNHRSSFGIAVEEFWQNFPRALGADKGRLCLGLFPSGAGDLHELQGGERKTHRFMIALQDSGLKHSAPTGDSPPAWQGSAENLLPPWTRAHGIAHASPHWYAKCATAPYLSARSKAPQCESQTTYLRLLESMLTGPDSIAQKRERIDEYGWRNYGDLHADHEATSVAPGTPFVSHYNNQYDAVFGFGVHFLGTGDRRWFDLMDELARHVVDIDLYHCTRDKAAYNGGMFWHTFHYVDAGTSSHRSYPAAKGVPGGGPSGGHCYTSGLLMHWLLTGNRWSRDAVVMLADYIVNADDGRKTPFRFLARGNTGHITSVGTVAHHGAGRGAGNSLNALVDGHRLTCDPKYLDKAESLIRRTVHPSDSLGDQWFHDRENYWSYTIFLQALAKYLDHKVELGQLDGTFDYARRALETYTRWSIAGETPYLDNPERLEYPNETWAAQELQKSLAYILAAPHVEADLAERCAQKAQFFFSKGVQTLASMPTVNLERPRVLLLSKGYAHSWLATNKIVAAPRAESSKLLPHSRFVPQKVVAIRRAFGLLTIVLLVAVVFLGLLFF